jgi:ABC-type phosphate/phosphonate transport system ATPase subunit
MSIKTIQNQFEITLIMVLHKLNYVNYEIVRYIYYKHV